MTNNAFKFSKMHGLGNDFVVIETITQACNLDKKTMIEMACRKTGIGFDQLLLIAADDSQSADFRYQIFNADGSEVGQCGNGARCVAKFVSQQGLSAKSKVTLRTKTATIQTELLADGQVKVNMGQPKFLPQDIPLQFKAQQKHYEVRLSELNNQQISFVALSLGNPHAVLLVPHFDSAYINRLGEILNNHRLFPEGVNVGFVQLCGDDKIKLRVYERGVGETNACGSGACAGVVATSVLGLVKEQVEVELLGGHLTIAWPAQQDVLMTGPANFVFEGQYAPSNI